MSSLTAEVSARLLPPESVARIRAFRWRNAPLPEPHLIGLAVGTLLGLVLPWRVFSRGWVGHVVGWPVIVIGAALAVAAVSAAAEVDLERPGRLVAGGPYRFSRNPMYLGWTLLAIGIPLVVNMAWPLVLLPFVLVVTHLVVLREERDLEAEFGESYASYRARVRRYL